MQEMARIKCYSELIQIPEFAERFAYLRLDGQVGESTFGFDRYLNQRFYHSYEWKRVRDIVIARDSGCDMGILDRPIGGKIYIHHMNPVMVRDVREATDLLLDPEYLICVSFDTHQAIHYGADALLARDPIVRRPNDTCPWKRS